MRARATKGKAAKSATPEPKLAEQLVLRDFLAAQLGYGTPEALSKLMADLSDKVSERGPDGQSGFLPLLVLRPNVPMLADLPRMDLNIMAHEAEMRRRRPEFRLLYFQYLAALFTEIFLTLWARDEAGLLLSLNDFLARGRKRYGDLSEFEGVDLRTLAFWLATGAGKTLLMHLALHQFAHYAEVGEGTGHTIFTPDARILVTPSAALSVQHLREFEQSGIEARPYQQVGAGFSGVQVIEITKLRADDDLPKKSGGVTVPVSHFAGANLVLVDEGHKGAATAAELKEENRWRSLRSTLAGDGFTLEYSATFAQVTEADKSGSLRQAYAHAVAFEYAYGRFYRDGYGKDFGVLNLQTDADEVLTERVMLSGLLALLEKRLAFDADPEAARQYNLFAPLMVFVGATVSGKNADSDIPAVLRLLGRVLHDREWATAEIERLLTGHSGLQDSAGRDALAGSFGLFKEKNLTSEQVYTELTGRIFGGAGGLRLQRLGRADSEVALWSTSGVRPFGVVTVGDPAKLLKNLSESGQLPVGLTLAEADALTGSLFAGISEHSSPVNVLIGSKMFVEGWSSWRVSVMGLLHVGSGAGAQVMQLFGRGVRLLGRAGQLRRSNVLEGEHPKGVAVQETLNLFGVKANYLQVLLDALGQEGVTPLASRELPIQIQRGWQESGLFVPLPDEDYVFSSETLSFEAGQFGTSDGVGAVPSLSLAAKVEVAKGSDLAAHTGNVGGTINTETRKLESVWPLIDEPALLRAAGRHKAERGWAGLYLPSAEVLSVVQRSEVTARPDFFEPRSPAELVALQAAAEKAALKALDRFYSAHQGRAESERMRAAPLTTDHPNFPKGEENDFAYSLRVPERWLNDIDQLVADASQRLKDAEGEPLPRLNFGQHLYAPLLTEAQSGPKLEVQATPKPLEPSEWRFVQHLRAYWQHHHAAPEWQDTEIWLLRNLPTIGVGFFRTAGFYPDFLLWVKKGEQQALAFVDPKGIRQMHLQDEKFNLHRVLESRRQAFGFYTTSFIVAQNLEDAPLRYQATETLSLEELAKHYHILNQDDAGSYVAPLLENLVGGL